MANRNFFKTVALVKNNQLPDQYNIGSYELTTLYQYMKEGVFLLDVINWCMNYGYVMGHRATVNGTYKESNGIAELEEIKSKLQGKIDIDL